MDNILEFVFIFLIAFIGLFFCSTCLGQNYYKRLNDVDYPLQMQKSNINMEKKVEVNWNIYTAILNQLELMYKEQQIICELYELWEKKAEIVAEFIDAEEYKSDYYIGVAYNRHYNILSNLYAITRDYFDAYSMYIPGIRKQSINAQLDSIYNFLEKTKQGLE